MTATAELPTVDDGQFRFLYRNTHTGETKEASLDLLLFRLACEQLETKHRLQVDAEGRYVATPDFLIELAATIERFGTACTPHAAKRLWCMATEMTETLKKNMNKLPSFDSGTAAEETPSTFQEKPEPGSISI